MYPRTNFNVSPLSPFESLALPAQPCHSTSLQKNFKHGINQEAAQQTTVSTNQLAVANEFITRRRQQKYQNDLNFDNVWRVMRKPFYVTNKNKMRELGRNFAQYINDRRRGRLCAAPGKEFNGIAIEDAFAANSGASMMFGPGTPSIKDTSIETTMILFALKFTQGTSKGRTAFKEYLENKIPAVPNNKISSKDIATTRSSDFFRRDLMAPLAAVVQHVLKKLEMERAILRAMEIRFDDDISNILQNSNGSDVINVQNWNIYQQLKRCYTKKSKSFDSVLRTGSSIANSSVRFHFAILHQFVSDFFRYC